MRDDAVTKACFWSQASFFPPCYVLWPEVTTARGRVWGNNLSSVRDVPIVLYELCRQIQGKLSEDFPSQASKIWNTRGAKTISLLSVLELSHLISLPPNVFMHKAELFVLDLSFIGWGLLTLISCGIAGIWYIPYYYTSHANFYKQLNGEI